MSGILDYKKKILSYREQEKVMDAWLKKRLTTVLPMVMHRWNQDMWIVACEEYNEDPVLSSLTPVSMITARRRMILVFARYQGEVHRFAITRPHIGLEGYYTTIWTKQAGQDWGQLEENAFSSPQPETQLQCLKRIIEMVKPASIALNYSENFAFGDGLSHTLYSQLSDVIKTADVPIVSAEKLCVSWLETRIEEELMAYDGIVEIAHALIKEAYSSHVILPGVTTNHDVKYFMMQSVIDLGLQPWFDFEVSIKRKGGLAFEEEEIILAGDILHCDIGLKYLGLCTDTQENAYILKPEECDAPAGILHAMKTVNRLQDIVMENFIEGRSGNEILKASRKQAIQEGIQPCIYTHPIGYHGHGAGPTIGLWDMQQGLDGLQGEYPLFSNTLYSLELNATVEIAQWQNEMLTFGIETDIIFADGKPRYANKRQTSFHLIR